MNVNYCERWFRPHKRAVELWKTNRARAAHDARTLYTAIIYDEVRPRCFVEVTGGSLAVEFLDDDLRSYVCYHFHEKKTGMLFLTMAIFRAFAGESNKVTHAAIYYFKENGQAVVHKEDDVADESWEANATLDVAANWEPYPAFGQYESLARLDRGLDLIH